MDKSRFTVNPQLDSEGFTLADARCHGCAPHEMCPRSGHCERYDSPLRYVNDIGEKGDALRAANPQGWVEVDGVKLPPISWAMPFDNDLHVTINGMAIPQHMADDLARRLDALDREREQAARTITLGSDPVGRLNSGIYHGLMRKVPR